MPSCKTGRSSITCPILSSPPEVRPDSSRCRLVEDDAVEHRGDIAVLDRRRLVLVGVDAIKSSKITNAKILPTFSNASEEIYDIDTEMQKLSTVIVETHFQFIFPNAPEDLFFFRGLSFVSNSIAPSDQ